MPSQDPDDPGFRRLRYVRYADDHLLGFTGPKTEAETIKHRLRQFLREVLKLELSEEKTRLLAGRCELCGNTDGIQVHQVRKLADLATPGRPPPVWTAVMAKRRRKALVVCNSCHHIIHAGTPAAATTKPFTGEP